MSEHTAENGAHPGKPYLSDDDIERADCRRREPPCGIIGKHTHGDRLGTFCGEPDLRVIPPGEGDAEGGGDR